MKTHRTKPNEEATEEIAEQEEWGDTSEFVFVLAF